METEAEMGLIKPRIKVMGRRKWSVDNLREFDCGGERQDL